MFLSQRASVPFGGKKWNNLYNDLDLMEEVEKEWQKEESAKELQINLLIGIQKLLTKILDTDLQYGYEIARNTGFSIAGKAYNPTNMWEVFRNQGRKKKSVKDQDFMSKFAIPENG